MLLIKSLFFSCCVLLGLAACGGGGGNSLAPDVAVGNGGLTLLVGDGPRDDFDAIILTVDNIVLLGDDGQVDLALAEPVIVDLLQLRNITELLIDTEVPAGTYSKIRLIVSGLVLQVLDDAGNVVSSQTPPLPANSGAVAAQQVVAAPCSTVLKVNPPPGLS